MAGKGNVLVPEDRILTPQLLLHALYSLV